MNYITSQPKRIHRLDHIAFPPILPFIEAWLKSTESVVRNAREQLSCSEKKSRLDLLPTAPTISYAGDNSPNNNSMSFC